jgi:hypothetical protein
MMKRTLIFVSAMWALVGVAAEGFKDEPGKHLDVMKDGKPLLRYMYEFDVSTPEEKHDHYKVYCHVLGPDGKPITKGPGGKFTHHRGIFLGWAKIKFGGKGYDLWHMKNGFLKHGGFESMESGPDANTIVAKISWEAADGTKILSEKRTIKVHQNDDAYLTVDFVCDITAEGDVAINGDPEHAGFQYRPHNDVVGNKSATYVYPEGVTKVQAERDMPWAAMTYTLGDAKWTVQHMNHPDNPKGTRYSAYRDYGRFGAFPVKDLKKGEAFQLKYRIRITKGEAPGREVFVKQHAAFTK